MMADTHRLPRPVAAVWDWQMNAACRGMDSEVFFHPDRERGPRRTGREIRAKQVCRSCPVIAACRRHALSVQEPYGVWGGLSAGDRTALLRGVDGAPVPVDPVDTLPFRDRTHQIVTNPRTPPVRGTAPRPAATVAPGA